MARDECLEMTVVEGSDISTESKHPIEEQKDEIIFQQTESHGSAGGLIEVYKSYKSSITRLAIDDENLGIYPPPRNYQLWLHTPSRMGSVGPLYPIQFTQWRSSIADLRKSACWLWILPHCNISGRNGVHVR